MAGGEDKETQAAGHVARSSSEETLGPGCNAVSGKDSLKPT